MLRDQEVKIVWNTRINRVVTTWAAKSAAITHFFAHRRLWCMYLAGCQSIHVRAIMKNKVFDAFARKADGLGRSLTKMQNAATHQPSATHFITS